MDRPTCKTCLYWDDSPFTVGTNQGICRKRPPNPARDVNMWGGPRTVGGEWCGEHSDFPEYVKAVKEAKEWT